MASIDGRGGRGQRGRGGDHRGGHQRDDRSGGHSRGGGDRGRGRGFGRGSQSGSSGQRGGHSRGGYSGGDYLPRSSQIVHNVRELAEIPVLENVKRMRMKGSEGVAIDLIANHYMLSLNDSQCFHYDIEIKLIRSDGKGFIPLYGTVEKKLRKEQLLDNVKIVKTLANEWIEVFGGKQYVFDGNKNIYTGEKLAIADGQHLSRDITLQLDGFREQTFKVYIQFANEVPINTINDFFEGSLPNATSDDFREALQALEIAIRYKVSQTLIPVGSNLFSKENQIPIRGENALIASGHHQSIHMTEVGLTVNINTTQTLFRNTGTDEQPRSLLDFIAEELNVRVNELDRTAFDQYLIQRLSRKITGLKVYTTHVNNTKMRLIIDSLTDIKPNKCKIEIKEKDGTIRETTNVEDYFRTQYRIVLKYKNIPLILQKGGQIKRYFPVEVCYVYPNQPMPKMLIKSSDTISRAIIETSSKQKPIEKFSGIQESMEVIANESADAMQMFGLTFNLKPIQLKGRVLKEPKVEGTQNRVKVGTALTEWCFFNLSQPVGQEFERYFNRFFGELIQTANSMGIKITPIDFRGQPPKAMSGPYKGMATIAAAFKRAKQLCPKLQMIFFCIPNTTEIYEAIKNVGDIHNGVMSQCLNEDKFMTTPRGYFNNILLKINAKLDGTNQTLVPNQRPDVMIGKKNATMIVGIDVTHPGTNPLANERVISSIAACVGSYDSAFSKYYSCISVQTKNVEIVQSLDVMIGQLLQQWYKHNNNTYPKSIVVYRDGVSEGQFSQVQELEIPLITKACREVSKSFNPLITFFVVQKRHNDRFLTKEQRFDFKGRPVNNIPSGTVVDNTIVNPLNDEFHLCSHNGMLGTSRHSKYVVLRDDHKLSPDMKQMMSYYLCWSYCRSTKPISIPTPVNYSHLAAFRAKHHIAAQNIQFQESHERETPEEQQTREERNIMALNNSIQVDVGLRKLFYYC